MTVAFDTIRPLERDAAGVGRAVEILDQTLLPHETKMRRLERLEDAAEAISAMRVRGAPLIGVTAAYGLALAAREDASAAALDRAAEALIATRPTAINLAWAVTRARSVIDAAAPAARRAAAWAIAAEIAEEDIRINAAIGAHGLKLIRDAAAKKPAGEPVQILTHCNAGALATVAHGTATAPIYAAQAAGLPVHVWVDETRPRNQGAALTAWELGRMGVAHTVIADNAGGLLMRAGRVDLCFVGSDRTTANGDVCNKIGTYLKALAARDCGVPFFVCLPSPTIDFTLAGGDAIPIEERSAREVTHIAGFDEVSGSVREVRVTPPGSPALNPAFDVTPARLVSGLVTERGVIAATREAIAAAFAEAPA